jgi:hypothetical protein
MVGAPVGAIIMDDSIYPKAQEFDGFRFWRLREQEGEDVKFLASDANPDYLHFGTGSHAWYLKCFR